MKFAVVLWAGLMSSACVGNLGFQSKTVESSSSDSSGGTLRAVDGRVAYAIISRACGSCHAGTNASGGIGNLLDAQNLLNSGLIVAGQSANSPLYKSIAAKRMPPGEALSTGDTQAIRDWIDGGATGYADGSILLDTPPTSMADATTLIRKDLAGVSAADRASVRYLTLNHLGGAKRRLAVQSLDKALNSVHWRRSVGRVTPIDGGANAVRIDLRDFDLTADKWNAIVGAAGTPYRVYLPSDPDFTRAMGSGSIIRGDWMVRSILQPDLYKLLLELPANVRDIETRLGVNVDENIAAARVMRAGFRRSGVSANNRVIERHLGPFGPYWKSYDFASSTGNQDILLNPLGPSPVGSDASRAFVHAGGEYIWTLPNGLHGYYLSDGAGRELHTGPLDIVRDPTRRDLKVTNSTSCFTCHVAGWIQAEDEIRAYAPINVSPFTPDQLARVQALYVSSAVLKTAFAADLEAYRTALKSLDITVGAAEPVSAITLAYDRDLTTEDMARELETTASRLLKVLGDDSSLRGRLAADAFGRVTRPAFEAAYEDLFKACR